MRRVGVTPALLKTTQKITCPHCGLEFSCSNPGHRCKGCRKASFGCQLARCLRCDNEFPLEGPLVKSKEKEKQLADYMNNIVANYNRTTGKKGTR